MQPILAALDACNITAAEFIISLLTNHEYKDIPANNLAECAADILRAFLKVPATRDTMLQAGITHIKTTYLQEMRDLASEEGGWHFKASSMTTKDLEGFRLDDMAQGMQATAPSLWSLFGLLQGEKEVRDEEEDRVLVGDEPDDTAYWDELDPLELEGFVAGLTGETGIRLSAAERWMKRRTAIKLMVCGRILLVLYDADLLQKKIVTISILMQSTNQKANGLQSILGIFLQSAHASQKVIDTFARIGVSISTDSTNLAIRSLSTESVASLRQLGHSLLASYAYDNFDVDLKSGVPLAERSNESLKHLTSGLLFPLTHGVTTDDLKCSKFLWKRSALNPDIHTNDLPPRRSWQDLVTLHLESPNSDLSRRDKFNSWVFLNDLCTNGPEYFHQFKGTIRPPNPIEELPLTKTPILAARAMDVNNSTVSGNIRAVIELLEQGGIYDPEEIVQRDIDSPDITEHVVLVHGDLGTGERLQAVQLRQSIESTPWRRFQHIIFIPGLFHLKMACADAIWRCFIQPQMAREDTTSLMHDVSQLRPKETGIFCSKPGFRRMHQLIGHAGICRRLDCWRAFVHKKDPWNFDTLESFAKSEPSLNDLREMADEMVQLYVTNHKLQRKYRRCGKERDLQHENALLLNKYFLLYEELSYAMNCGDIGRVETCIIGWIPILKAIGKHKYATHMTNFLLNVHFVYPEGLK